MQCRVCRRTAAVRSTSKICAVPPHRVHRRAHKLGLVRQRRHACLAHIPVQKHTAYDQLWLMSTDGTPGKPLTEITSESVGYWDYGYRDAWPMENGSLRQTSGDAGSHALVFMQDGQIQPFPNIYFHMLYQ